MFTGIVTTTAKIKGIKRKGGVYQLEIISRLPISGLEKGESIAIDGVCLTVREVDNNIVYFDVIPSTFNNTRFRYLKTGSVVNLETPLTLQRFISGHFVTGHIDCLGEVCSIKRGKDTRSISIRFPSRYRRYVVDRGSIAVNGVSLTVQKITSNIFSVDLIPTTLSATNLGGLKIGDRVNLEFDYLGKYILNYLDRYRVEGS